ncbi:NAD(+)--arginine ADP-ribosyltransferase EFV [Bacillus licheniformis]|uniref:phage head morphogenesis protein n=1 Tax=Bacillus licheniformis TaxID=1402 RepID=UPI0011A68566|nr:phage minor head protein [Bacillus licheniformis]TWK08606.1 NAD(+)--arginine ADP-ribosyltransferase EFV [Bacillus licheniformis]
MQQVDKWQKELNRLSAASYKDMDKELFKYYKDALKRLKIEIKGYIENYDELSFSKRLEVEQQIKTANRIDEILWELSNQSTPRVHGYLADEAADAYYGVWYALEGMENIQMEFPTLSENYIERLIEKKVAGKTFSKRLYTQRDELAKRVTTALFNGAVNGKGYGYVAKEVGELTEASYKQALRIARTEGGRVQSTAKQRAYKEAEKKGVKLEKMWMATLDKKTRHSHQELDGQTVGVDEQFEYKGLKADGPRLFGAASQDINCRCTTIAVVNGIKPELRRDNEGKKVSSYKSYNEWAEAKGYKKPDKKPKPPTFEADKVMSKTNMRSRVGETNYSNFVSHLSNVSDDKQIKLYDKFGGQLTYSHLEPRANFARNAEVHVSQQAFDGIDGKKPPMMVVYHENAHAIDHLGLKALTGQETYATGRKIKKKVLRKRVEVEETINHASGLPQYKLKETINRDLWEYVNGKDLPMFEDLGPKPRKKDLKQAWEDKRAEIYDANNKNMSKFMDEMKTIKSEKEHAITALSDIVEATGMTGRDRPFGWGHGSSYWKESGKMETEFFAHVAEARASNPDSFELLSKVFPNSVKVWDDIVDDILKAGD